MDHNAAFGMALRRIRKLKKLTQEDFSAVSSRTYLSTLERGIKSPTLHKIDQLAETLNVHPLTILIQSYLIRDPDIVVDELWARITSELGDLAAKSAAE